MVAPLDLVSCSPDLLYTGERTLQPGETCTATMTGWSLGMRITGCVIWRHPAGELTSDAGEIMLIRPGVPQSWYVPPGRVGSHSAWAVFFPRAHWLEWLQYPEIRPGYARIRFDDRKIFRAAFEALCRAHHLATSDRYRREELALSAIEEALLWCREDQQQQSAGLDPRVQAAVAFLVAHLAESLTLEQVARASHSSRARLAALFRQQTGLPPMAFLERERMRRARHLLQSTPLRIARIAQELGYADPKYFAQRFKRSAGLTPEAFRRRQGPARGPDPPA